MDSLNHRNWLTPAECAAYLGISVRALYNRVHRGHLPFQKLGHSLRFRRKEIDACLIANGTFFKGDNHETGRN